MDMDILSRASDQELDICLGIDADCEGDEEDIDIVDNGSELDEGTRQFNRIVGALEGILIDPEFELVRESFCRSNCLLFNPNDAENSLHHTAIFSSYTQLVEGTIEGRLQAEIDGFDMSDFIAMMAERKDQLMSEEEIMTAPDEDGSFDEEVPSISCEPLHIGKGEKSGAVQVNGPSPVRRAKGGGLRVSVQALKVHSEEQEDGEERPDLNGFALTISSPQGTKPNAEH